MQFFFVRFVKKTISKKIQKFTVVFDVFKIKIENNELIRTKNNIMILLHADCLICAKYNFYCKREKKICDRCYRIDDVCVKIYFFYYVKLI